MDLFVGRLIKLETCSHLEQVQEIVQTAAQPLGYDRFVMFSTTLTRDNPIASILWIEGDWFGNEQVIDVTSYVRHCPVTRHFLQTDDTFFWTKSSSKGEEKYQITSCPTGSGIHGLQVPIFGKAGLEGAISFGGENINFSSPARVALTTLGIAAFRATKRLAEAKYFASPTYLSPREREVLRWTAIGRRQIDIAAELGLSERTVENHLRRVRVRLGVATTAQAVAVATHEGLLEVHQSKKMKSRP